MPENAVKYHMEISTVHQNSVFFIKSSKLRRMKIHHSPVCSEWADRTIQLVNKTAQCHIQKTHTKIQLIPRRPEDAAADVLETLGCLLGTVFLTGQEVIFIVFGCFYFVQFFYLL